mmetsp:Transcript_2905/g.12493  ORF Transcript_2905/g.12493 Transcript_2905/m.12493 type:complete len:241 (-) Transcript_2905:299-1021(-)
MNRRDVGRLGRRRRLGASFEELGSPPLALLPFNRGLQPGHRVGEPGHVVVDAAPEPVERGGQRPGRRDLRGPRPDSVPDTVAAPRLPRRSLPLLRLRPLLLEVLLRSLRVLRSSLEQRLELRSHRLVARVLRPDVRGGGAKRARRRRRRRDAPPELRRPSLDVVDITRRERSAPAAALHGLDEPRHVVEHRRRLLHRGGYVLHDGLETRLAGVAPRAHAGGRRAERGSQRLDLLSPLGRG